MKKLPIIATITAIILFFYSTEAQQGLLLEGSAGYTTSINSPTLLFNTGYAIGTGCAYFKFQIHNIFRSDVVQIIGTHIAMRFDTWTPNIGVDYHAGNTDHPNPLNGTYFSFGLQKGFKEHPWVISIGQSGKLTTVSVGISLWYL